MPLLACGQSHNTPSSPSTLIEDPDELDTTAVPAHAMAA
jgi:hypothetical protein